MRIKTNNFKKNILFLIVVMFLFFGNLVAINAYELNYKIEDKWIIIFLFSAVLLSFMLFTKNSLTIKYKRNRNKFIFLLLWEMFIATIFISMFLHEQFYLFEFLLFSILIPISFFSNKILKYKNTILTASIFSIIPLIHILGPMNSLGTIICLTGINLLNLLKIYKNKDIYMYIVIVIFGVGIFITESRTSLIAFLVVSVLIIFTTLKEENKSFNKWLKNALKILVVLILIYFSFNHIHDLIFDKYTISNLDMLSGRKRIWIGTFQTGITLFGNGDNYFFYNYGIGDAHNTFIQVLGEYGILSFIILISIYVYIIFISIKYLKKIEYLCFFIGFLLLSLAENLFFVNSRMIYSNIIFLTYLGCIINESQ